MSDGNIEKGILGAIRGGARIAAAMTPEELSARSKKAAQTRKAARVRAASERQRVREIVQQSRTPSQSARITGYDPLTLMPRYSKPDTLNKYGAGTGSQYYLAVQRPKKRKKSTNPLVIDFDVQDAQDGMMDEHQLNDIAKRTADMRSELRKGLVARGGALIARSMTPQELSERSRKGWLTRARSGAINIKQKARQTGFGDGLPSQRRVRTIEGVNSVMTTLGRMAREAKEKGVDAPNYDLCKISIPGTNLFCGSHRGKTRDTMPQLGGKPRPGSAADKLPRDKDGAVNAGDAFKEHLKKTGVKMTPQRVRASSLKASQMELVGANVGGMVRSAREGKFDPSEEPIYVSRDGYVIDGHHRWAAVVGLDAEDGKLGGSTMNVQVLDMDIDEALKFVEDFASEFGILPKAAKTGDSTVKKYLGEVLGAGADIAYEYAYSRAYERMIAKGLVSSATRGGARIAAAMTPEERSLRSKKGWLKRQRARIDSAVSLEIRPVQGLGDRERAQLRAMQILAAGISVEPIITRVIKNTVNQYGGRMAYLKHRLKKADRLAEKILDKAKKKGMDIDDYALAVGDAVRYTAVIDDIPPGSYVSAIKSVINKLQDQGVELVGAIETHWLRGDDYNGVHLVGKFPNGTLFELQFHTSGSLRAKNMTHKIYAEVRKDGVPDSVRAAGVRRMTQIADSVPVPKGALGVGVRIRRGT